MFSLYSIDGTDKTHCPNNSPHLEHHLLSTTGLGSEEVCNLIQTYVVVSLLYFSGGFYMKPEDGNVYTTLEPTLSSNPNVFFQRSGVHPGMMY
jgi:hypothetical protein